MHQIVIVLRAKHDYREVTSWGRKDKVYVYSISEYSLHVHPQSLTSTDDTIVLTCSIINYYSCAYTTGLLLHTLIHRCQCPVGLDIPHTVPLPPVLTSYLVLNKTHELYSALMFLTGHVQLRLCHRTVHSIYY